MPSEGRLPPGAPRELTAAIYELYQSAGKPGTRTISLAIRKREDLRDTVSHEAIRGILRGTHTKWLKIEAVVLQLAEWAVTRPDPQEETKRIQVLWLAAEEAHSQLINSSVAASAVVNAGSAAVPAEAATVNDGVPTASAFDLRSQLGELMRTPVISWNPSTGTVDVYDRQVAMQMIKDMRGPS